MQSRDSDGVHGYIFVRCSCKAREKYYHGNDIDKTSLLPVLLGDMTDVMPVQWRQGTQCTQQCLGNGRALTTATNV